MTPPEGYFELSKHEEWYVVPAFVELSLQKAFMRV
jgi:hypothetical protein